MIHRPTMVLLVVTALTYTSAGDASATTITSSGGEGGLGGHQTGWGAVKTLTTATAVLAEVPDSNNQTGGSSPAATSYGAGGGGGGAIPFQSVTAVLAAAQGVRRYSLYCSSMEWWR